MKLKDLMIVVPLALAVAACGRSSTEPEESSSSTTTPKAGAPLSGNPSPTPVVVPTPTPTPTPGAPGPTVPAGCPQNPSRSFYEYFKQGTGNTAVYTANEVIADSKLRVSLEPSSAGTTAGTGGTAAYTRMSADVHLLKDGIEVAMKAVPVQSNSTTGYSTGIPVGQRTSPSLLDFSPYLNGPGTYSIKIDNIRTDYKCNSFCTVDAPDAGCSYYYNPNSYYTTYCSYTWNWDYHQSQYVCCYTGYLQQCQRQQCGVGTILDNSTWSVYVRVETDYTTCLPQ